MNVHILVLYIAVVQLALLHILERRRHRNTEKHVDLLMRKAGFRPAMDY